jgi:hypothetical protein
MSLGQRAVGFVENLDEGECPEVEREIAEVLGPAVTFVRRPAGGRLDLVYGLNDTRVREATALLDALETVPRHQPEIIQRIGHLLGYPDCCVQAFCVPDAFRHEQLAWTYVQQRSAAPGAVDPRLNPYTGLKLYHLPCRIDCPATLAQIEAATRALGQERPGELREALALAAHPVVFALNSFPQFAVLDQGQEVEPGLFHYRRVQSFGRLSSVLEQGDRLRVEQGVVTVLAGREVRQRIEGEVAVWWPGRALDPDWWLGEVKRQRARYSRLAHRPAD